MIVESPTKATKIASFLGDGYIVESSRGHIRDLPAGAAEVPAKYKGEKWARTGVDVDNGFEPLYVVNPDKQATLRSLKAALARADELLLATDGDREGEAIAWHLLQELKPKVRPGGWSSPRSPRGHSRRRGNPRDLDADLVDAQETRRILDRLYGYEVSPVLWKKVMPRLSAGRVQSVATRLMVDRERDGSPSAAPRTPSRRRPGRRRRRRAADVSGPADPRRRPPGRPGSGLQRQGSLHPRDRSHCSISTYGQAEPLAATLRKAGYAVRSIESKPYTRRPYAPFKTSTLQQEAGRKLGFTAQRAMSVAQDLYESGFITYMRTDSTTLSPQAVGAARSQVRQLFGGAVRAGQAARLPRTSRRTPRRPTRRSGPRARGSTARRRPGSPATSSGSTS